MQRFTIKQLELSLQHVADFGISPTTVEPSVVSNCPSHGSTTPNWELNSDRLREVAHPTTYFSCLVDEVEALP